MRVVFSEAMYGPLMCSDGLPQQVSKMVAENKFLTDIARKMAKDMIDKTLPFSG